MRYPWDRVQWGIGDGEPEPVETVNHPGHGPEWLYLRTSSGEIQAIDIHEARCHVRGTKYFPWSWIGLLQAEQVIEVPSGFICISRVKLQRVAEAA